MKGFCAGRLMLQAMKKMRIKRYAALFKITLSIYIFFYGILELAGFSPGNGQPGAIGQFGKIPILA
jgi:hypothetical protein